MYCIGALSCNVSLNSWYFACREGKNIRLFALVLVYVFLFVNFTPLFFAFLNNYRVWDINHTKTTMSEKNTITVTSGDGIDDAIAEIEVMNLVSDPWELNIYFEVDDYPEMNNDFCDIMYRLGRACHTANCKGVWISAHDDKPQFWCSFLDGLDGKTSPYMFAFMNPAPGNNCEVFLEAAQHMTNFDDEDDSTGIEAPIDTALFQSILKLIKSNAIVSLCLLGAIPDLQGLTDAFAAQDSIKILEIHIDEPEDGRVLGNLKGLEHLVISSRFQIQCEKVVHFDNHLFDALTLGFTSGNFDKLESLLFIGGSLCPPFDTNLNGKPSLTGISDLHPMDMSEEEAIFADPDLKALQARCLRSAEHNSWAGVDPPSYWKLFCEALAKSAVKTFVLSNMRFDVDLATCDNDCNNLDPEEVVDFGDGVERTYKRIIGHGAHTPYLFKCLLETPNPALRTMMFEVPYEISNTLGATVAQAFVSRYKCDAFFYNSRSHLSLDKIASYRDKMPIPWMHEQVPGIDRNARYLTIPDTAITNEKRHSSETFLVPVVKKIAQYCDNLVYGAAYVDDDKFEAEEDEEDEVVCPPTPKRPRME